MIILAELAQRYPNSFAVRVRGRSMEPAFLDGDGVLVDRSAVAADGDPVVVRIPSGLVIGWYRVAANGRVWLEKNNREVIDALVLAEHEVVGVIVSIIRREIM